jgi:hypothetical protein
MKKVYWIGIVMIIGVLFVFAGLQAGQDKEMPPAEAEAFWTYITETHPYMQWDFFPGYDSMYPGESPHGAYLKLYANDIAIKAANAGEPMPDGAILVKENYGENQKDLMAITPMYKKKGYNPEGGDWFWAKYGPDGSVETSGKVDGCIQCHKAAHKDMIFSQPK